MNGKPNLWRMVFFQHPKWMPLERLGMRGFTKSPPIKGVRSIMSRCECDYDWQGDPGEYVKMTRYCPEHDTCTSCVENLGVVRADKDWLCAECAAEFGVATS